MIFQVSPGRRRQHKEAGSRTKTLSKEAQNRSQMCETTSHFQPPALELPQKVLQEVRMASEIAAKAPKSTRESFQEQARLPQARFLNAPPKNLHRGKPTWRPRRPRRAPEDHLGPPGRAKFDPRVAKFDPRGFLFGTPGRRFFNPLRAPFLLCSRHLARRNARSD